MNYSTDLLSIVQFQLPDWRETAPRMLQLKTLFEEFRRENPNEWPRIRQLGLELDAEMESFLLNPPVPWSRPTIAMKRASLRWYLRKVQNIPDPLCAQIANSLEIEP